MAGAPGVASGIRDPDRSGDSAGSVERSGFQPSSRATRASMCFACVPRISMNQSARLQNLVRSGLNLLTHKLAQGLDEPDCR